jgi:malonate transporter and related proteins
MTAILIDSLVPIFAVMGLGYFAGWARQVDNHHVAELNALVMEFALPASLFVATATTPWAMLRAEWPLLLALCVAMLALYGLSYWMQRRLFAQSPSASSIQALTVAFPNLAATGIPLIIAVFGASKAIYVALALAVGAVTISPLTLAILGANKPSPNGEAGAGLALRAVGRAFLNPVVLAPIAGIAFAFLSISLPQAVTDAFLLIGQATGGVALFLTGLILSSQRLLINSNVISGVLLKNVALPLAVAGLMFLLPTSRESVRAAILLAALPSGFFGVLFGLRYGVESREVGSTLILSSVLSIVTLALGLIFTAGL